MRLFIAVTFFALIIEDVSSQKLGDMEIVAEWIKVDFDWDSEEQKDKAISDGTFIQNNNLPSGIKIYGDTIFVTVPRWLPGIPSTMNTLVYKEGVPLLKPYPNWEMQKIGIQDCSVFQYTQSMEIDSDNDEMWVIDVGRKEIFLENSINDCPPKLMIVNLKTDNVTLSYTFPDAVLSANKNFVNDIVVDPEGRFAYMSDTGVSAEDYKGGIIVYNRNSGKSHRIQHKSMKWETNRPDGGYDMRVNGSVYSFPYPSNGIALSPDKNYLFYCPLGGVRLYAVATSILRSCTKDVCNLLDSEVKNLGSKFSETDGMAMGHKSLFYTALGRNAIYKWNYRQDIDQQRVRDVWNTRMTKQVLVKKDDVQLIWPDTLAFDNKGWLYVTANRIAMYANGQLDFSGRSGPNFRIVKIYVDDTSYLSSSGNPIQQVVSSILFCFMTSLVVMLICFE